jgi:GR25 family glycosyltransferase involved in LPS biosynthesis
MDRRVPNQDYGLLMEDDVVFEPDFEIGTIH